MTVKQELTERVNRYLAAEIWRKVSTEYEDSNMQGRFATEAERYEWLIKRSDELLKQYMPRRKNEKEIKD